MSLYNDKIKIVLGDYSDTLTDQIAELAATISAEMAIPTEATLEVTSFTANVTDNAAELFFDIVLQKYELTQLNWLEAIKIYNEFINASVELTAQLKRAIEDFVGVTRAAIPSEVVYFEISNVFVYTENEAFNAVKSEQVLNFDVVVRVMARANRR